MTTFEGCLVLGSRGIAAVRKWLNDLPETIRIVDVQSDHAWQEEDVDLLWYTTARLYKVKVRYEQEFTGNIFVETVSNDASTADLMFYGFEDEKAWYLLALKDMARFIKEHGDAYTVRYVQNGGYQTRGLVVPIADVALIADYVEIERDQNTARITIS